MIEDFIDALRSFSRSKTRTVLSLLGVIIGVASVIVITSIGKSSTKQIEDTFGSSGLDVVSISSGYMRRNRDAVTLKFDEEFREDLDSPMDTMTRIRKGIKRGIEESDIHGFLPETNRGLYLNGLLGKGIINTEFIPFYYADLRNSFFITEMSDMTLPRVSDRVALEKFGLNKTDKNIHNIVCDRLIDYGGIQISSGQRVNSFDYWEDSSSI